MHAVDRLFRFLSVTGLWLIAAMLYVMFFHEGGRFGDTKAASAPPPPALPTKFAVYNADGAPLKIAGEVTMAPQARGPAPKLRVTCKLAGMITTASPSLRFSSEW